MNWMLAALFIMVFTGCANTKEASRLMLHGGVDAACTVAHKSIDVALGPIEDLQADATIVVDKAKSFTQ